MVIFNEEKILKWFIASDLTTGGWICSNWGTVIEKYTRPPKDDRATELYYHTEKKVFFENSIPEEDVFKVIIAGSRGFRDYPYLEKKMDKILANKTRIQIISGHCPSGADFLGEVYAKKRGYDLKLFPADWDKFGKGAGHIRNREMAEYADACALFWDGKSPGSTNMAKLASDYKLKFKSFTYETKTQKNIK